MSDAREIFRESLFKTLEILGEVTSPSYSHIVVSQIMAEESGNHPILEDVRLSGGKDNPIILGESGGWTDDEGVISALGAVITRIDSMSKEFPFKSELLKRLGWPLDSAGLLGITISPEDYS